MTDAPSWADAPVIDAPAPAWADVPVPPVDKYRAAAIEERDRLSKQSWGMPGDPGVVGAIHAYTDRAKRPFTMGWGDEAAAAIGVPGAMIQRGTINPAEAYRYTKARADLEAEKVDEATKGWTGGLAEAAGIAGSLGNFMGSGTRAAARVIPGTKATIPAGVMNTGANAARGAAYGAIQGAGDAPDVNTMAQRALAGGVFGGVLGGVLPVAAKSIGSVAGVSQLPRLRDPTNVATAEVAAAARAAGVTPEQLIERITQANQAGQGEFTVADAIGKEGQRKLAGLAKQPGEQRDLITKTIAERNTNLPINTGARIGEALGAPQSAEAARTALIDTARTQAAPLYRAAEQVPTWSPRIQQFIDDPIAQAGLRHGVELQRLRSVGSDRPFNPRDAMITGFNEAGDPIISGVPNMQTLHTLKVGLDRMIENEINPHTHRLNARGEALTGFRNRLLEEVDSVNPLYAQARAVYGGPMAVSTAVRAGQQMPSTGRAADTVPRFEALPPTTQQGVRIGYADAVRDRLERGGNYPSILQGKSQKGTEELNALSLHQGPYQPGRKDPLREYLDRNEVMRQTSKDALGGSSTAENLADMANSGAGSAAIGLAGNAASGNMMGAARNAIEVAKALGSGQSEAQRVAITQALLERDPAKVREMAARIALHEEMRRGVNPHVSRPPRFAPGQ